MGELNKLHLEEEDLRSELINFEIREKVLQEELHKSGLQDVRHLVRALASLRSENEGETDFLQRQIMQLIKDKIRLQQHVVSLTSRVDNTDHEVREKAAPS